MQTEGKMQTEEEINEILVIKNTRNKPGSNEGLGVFVRVPVILLSEIPKTQTKKCFLALVKHYIINSSS